MERFAAPLHGKHRLTIPGDERGLGTSAAQRVAWAVVLAGPLCAIVSALALLSGSVAQQGEGSALPTGSAFALLPCGALLVAAVRARNGAYAQAAVISVLGGVLAFVDLVVAALSAGYANPCFEQVSCTAGPTAGYALLTAAAFGFLLAAAIGIILGPVALLFLARRAA
jgi:hypothetical protein